MSFMDAERERWAALYLARLERLCHLEERFASPPEGVKDPRRLVYKATFSAYCACVVLGHKTQAEGLLARSSQDVGRPDAAPPWQVEPIR